MYNLSPIDQADYNSCSEMSFYEAPEVISEESKQSQQSDIFAFGAILITKS